MLPLNMSPDTTPEAARVQLAALRRLGPEGRLLKAFELSNLVATLYLAGMKRRAELAADQEADRARRP